MLVANYISIDSKFYLFASHGNNYVWHRKRERYNKNSQAFFIFWYGAASLYGVGKMLVGKHFLTQIE